MRRSNFALRLQPSLLEELRKIAELEGVALNQLINVAVAEKVSALRTEEYFRERAVRANRAQTLRILERSGKGKSPRAEDELSPSVKLSSVLKKPARTSSGKTTRARPATKRTAR